MPIASGVGVLQSLADGPADPADPEAAAVAAGLRYVSDRRPGIRRRRAGKGFAYTDPAGQPVRDRATLARIRAIVIPPAWTDVWICTRANGHIQATGRDARGRKQYRYHARFREARDAAKYERMIAFGEALPRIRERAEQDLRLPGMPRERILGAVVRLLDETSIRVGNEEYRKQNHSFGLTTLRTATRQTRRERGVRFEFVGKGGKQHRVELHDRKLARVIRECQELPGQELFQYLDEDGLRRTVESDDVNAYLREISGGDFTAKDFRTWNGTVVAMRLLRVCPPCESAAAAKRQVTQAIKSVAEVLGNTAAVCRKAYVHPVVVNAYLEGSLQPEAGLDKPDDGLSEEEMCVLELLRRSAEEQPQGRVALLLRRLGLGQILQRLLPVAALDQVAAELDVLLQHVARHARALPPRAQILDVVEGGCRAHAQAVPPELGSEQQSSAPRVVGIRDQERGAESALREHSGRTLGFVDGAQRRRIAHDDQRGRRQVRRCHPSAMQLVPGHVHAERAHPLV